MPVSADKLNPNEIGVLLRGELTSLATWMAQWNVQRFAFHVGVILAGVGLYGAAMGWWRDPQQALYVAIKFPLIILLTVIGNALLNGMLAPLLGLNIRFRQSFSAILMSFTVAAAILGAFSPIMAFLVWNLPEITSKTSVGWAYSFMMLAHVAVIALAGATGNIRLFQLLVQLGGNRTVALRVFGSLAGRQPVSGQPAFLDFAPVHRVAWFAGGIPSRDRLPRKLLRSGFSFAHEHFPRLTINLTDL